MDSIGRNRVSIQIANGLDLIGLAVELDLVGLHHLLDGLANIAEPHVYAGLADSGVCGRSDRLEQSIILGIEGDGPGAVDYVAVDVRAEVDLAHVVVLEDSVVAGVGRVVGGAVVERAAGGEGESGR